MIVRLGALLAATALAMPAYAAAMSQTPTAAPAVDATPLTAKWGGPYQGVPPWDKVRPAMFPVAFPVAMAEMRREIHAIRDDKRPATFKTVIEPLQLAGDMMDRVGSMWGVLFSTLAVSVVLTSLVGLFFGWIYLLAFRPRPTWEQLEAERAQAELDAERRAVEADAAELARVE